MKSIVKQSRSKLPKTSLVFGALMLIIIVCIAINPAKYSTIALNGLEIWAKVLVPSLLPFFVLTKLLSATGIIDNLCSFFAPLTKKLYNCPKQSAYVFLMSIITGYPVGSKLIADLYNSNHITQEQAIKTASFCSTSGPMFILGTVAIGMFASPQMGYVILASHILGALLNGVIYRGFKHKHNPQDNSKNNSLIPTQTQEITKTKSIKDFDFSQSIMSSINSMLLIGGVVCFAFVLLEVVISSPIFVHFCNMLKSIGLNSSLFTAILCGLGEITKGCLLLSSTAISSNLATIIATFIISFGGISTFLQAYAFLKGIVPAKTFLLQKLTHALCASLVSCLLTIII